MVSFNNLRIGTRLTLSMTALVIFLIVTISSIITYEVQRTLYQSAKAITQESALHYAYVMKAELEVALDEVRALASVVEREMNAGNSDAKSSYQRVNDILKYFLE